MAASDDPVDGEERRKRLRVPIEDVRVLMPAALREFPAKDLSLTGLGFPHLNWPFATGTVLTVNLLRDGRTIIEDIRVRVVRSDRHVVGCEFIGLTQEKQRLLYEILVDRARPSACEKSDDCLLVYMVGA